MKDVREAWARTLKKAGLEYFWIYNLRHTFANRLSAAGVADLFVAQMIGHSSPSILQILQRYSKAIDEFRRDAVRKLETCVKHMSKRTTYQPINRRKPQRNAQKSTEGSRPKPMGKLGVSRSLRNAEVPVPNSAQRDMKLLQFYYSAHFSVGRWTRGRLTLTYSKH